MSTAALPRAHRGVLREPWDALLILLALGHGALLLAVPSAVVVGLGLWWNSNTVAHWFLHRPFFTARPLNALFSLYLSVLLGVPQCVWRDRHLAHHASVSPRLHKDRQFWVEALAVVGLWAWLLIEHRWFFLTAYLPGYAAGLVLCALHGYYEHHRGTVDHRGLLYNLLFFNDGYHVEHHARPGEHWTRLPRRIDAEASTSRWPAVLRWLEWFSLDGLEKLVLRSRLLQRFVLASHERAFRRLLPELAGARRVCIVGGGLYPRTLLVLRRLLPEAEFTVLDMDADNLDSAKRFLGGEVSCLHARYAPELVEGYDLVVFPLAFVGEREAIYGNPPSALVVVHDWLWRRRGVSAIVSLMLLKRVNLVRGTGVRRGAIAAGSRLNEVGVG